MRGEREGKALAVIDSCGGGDERCGEQRRASAEVVEAEGRDGVHDASRESWEGGIEETVAGADAGLTGGSEDFAPEALVELWRVGEADARGEVFIAGGGDGGGDTWIAGYDEALRGSGIEG